MPLSSARWITSCDSIRLLYCTHRDYEPASALALPVKEFPTCKTCLMS